MKESHGEGLATHTGPESWVGVCKSDGETLTGVTCRPGIQPRQTLTPERRRCKEKRKATLDASAARDAATLRAVRDPEHRRTHLAREPGEPGVARRGWCDGPCWEVYGRTPTMSGSGQSDSPAVPAKFPNKAGGPTAE